MRKIKRVKIGDYVFASRWGDHQMGDPWYIGHISEYGEDNRGMFYKLKECPNRYWRNVFKISEEEAEKRLEEAKILRY